jgi:hypothetical protein
VLGFFRVVFVPLGNFDHYVFCAVRDALAAQARFRGYAGGFVELVQFGVGGFVTRFQTFVNDHVAGGTGADAAAGVIQPLVIALRNIEDAAGKTVVSVGNFFGIDFDRLAIFDAAVNLVSSM